VNSLLSAPMNYEDLTTSRPASDYSTTDPCASIIARIEWCQRQETKVRTGTEFEEWRAEEEGLRDALLEKDCTYSYHYSPPSVCDRYALGLEDGQSLIRVACVESIWQPTI